MTLGQARAIVGSLGFPSKMPGTSYGLPAAACKIGSKLAKIPGTVCSICYALSGGAKYQMPRAALGQRKRLAAITHSMWVEAMVFLLVHVHSGPIKVDLGIAGVRLLRKGGSRFRWNVPGFHRWHDSGDLQSVEHLANICEVACRTPRIKHWVPTQEIGMVRAYIARGGVVPANLVIRLSSVSFDDGPRRAWPHTSAVYSGIAPLSPGHGCPAHDQHNECRGCRACWSPDVAHVLYKMH